MLCDSRHIADDCRWLISLLPQKSVPSQAISQVAAAKSRGHHCKHNSRLLRQYYASNTETSKGNLCSFPGLLLARRTELLGPGRELRCGQTSRIKEAT